MNLADLRKEYQQHALSEEDSKADPFEQFRLWLREALESEVMEPNAMTLATINAEGYPTTRVVLLKELDENGFVFYTNYESHKAKELAQNPKATLNFLWLELERQVRVCGLVEKVSRETSEAYFQTRPRESQIGAWVSPQSQVISGRTYLEERQAYFEEKFSGVAKIPLPTNWGGYRLLPQSFEFWQGRPGRLHDRLFYDKPSAGVWKRSRLAP